MDSTYILLQHYWWFLVSLLGALLVFLFLYKEANLYSSLSARRRYSKKCY